MGLAEILHAILSIVTGGAPHYLHDEIDKLAAKHAAPAEPAVPAAPAEPTPAEPVTT